LALVFAAVLVAALGLAGYALAQQNKGRFLASDSPESLLIGGPAQEKKQRCQRANPITYVTSDDPPFLIVHGEKTLLSRTIRAKFYARPCKKQA